MIDRQKKDMIVDEREEWQYKKKWEKNKYKKKED